MNFQTKISSEKLVILLNYFKKICLQVFLDFPGEAVLSCSYIAWVVTGNGFSRTVYKKLYGAPSFGDHIHFRRDGHRGRSAVHQLLHLRRSILHHHRVPRRSSPQPRRATFHPFTRRSGHWGQTRPSSVGQFARGVVKGEGEFFTVDTCASGTREESRCTCGKSTSQSFLFAGRVGFVGRASLETAKRQCRVQPVGERLDSCLKLVERTQGRIERQKTIVEEAQQLLTKCESQLAAGLQDLERLRAEARACPVLPT